MPCWTRWRWETIDLPRPPMPRHPLQHMDVIVAEPFEAPRRLSRHTIGVVHQHDTARAPRHQTRDLRLQPAVGNVDREQRVTRSVLPLLAHIDESDLAALGEPSSQPRDIKGGGHRHALPAASASIMPWCRCEDEPRAAVEFPCSQGE